MSARNIEVCNGNEGCFRSDPEALNYARLNGDMGIQRNNQALMTGAVKAAKQGTPFEDATYRPISFINMQSGTEGRERPVAEVADGSNDGGLKLRVARCAYACGSSAVGGCPLIKQ